MGKSAVLAINIIANSVNAVTQFNQAANASMTFKQKLGRAAVGATAALTGIVAGATMCVNAAGDLQQSIGGVETVFGSSSGKMLGWAKNAASSAGLSENAYNEMATTIGSQLQNMGMAQEASAEKTNSLIGLGADLSSMFGGTTTQAVDALSSALKGEMDPIEKYGISLNDATLKAKAQSMGLGDLYAAGDRNAKMQATLAAITDMSGKSVGNFAKEADTAQGQQARMTAQFDNAKAALGQSFLPALTKGAQLLASFAGWIQQNTAWLTPLAIVIGVLAGGIVVANAAWGAWNVVQGIVAATNLTTAGTFGILAGATGIGLIIAIVAVVIANWNKLPAFFSNLWAGIQNVFWTVVNAITGFLRSNFGQAILVVFAPILGVPNLIIQNWGRITSFFSSVKNNIVGAFTGAGNWLRSAGGDLIRGLWNGISDIGAWLWGKLGGFCSGIVDQVKGFFGIHSPSRLMKDEVGRYIGLGVGEGIISAAGSVQKDARRFSGIVSDELTGGIDLTLASGSGYTGSGKTTQIVYNVTIEGKVLDEEGTVAALKTMFKKYDGRRA